MSNTLGFILFAADTDTVAQRINCFFILPISSLTIEYCSKLPDYVGPRTDRVDRNSAFGVISHYPDLPPYHIATTDRYT